MTNYERALAWWAENSKATDPARDLEKLIDLVQHESFKAGYQQCAEDHGLVTTPATDKKGSQSP